MAEAAGYPFRLLDVFAERKHQGNQLLVLADSAAELSDVCTPSAAAASPSAAALTFHAGPCLCRRRCSPSRAR